VAIDSRKKAFNEAKVKARKEKKDSKRDEAKEAPRTRKWAPPQPSKKKKSHQWQTNVLAFQNPTLDRQ
jgi:hypothetical protein